MENFELVFACAMADGSIAPHILVIAAPDRAWTRRIAGAMVGEMVNIGQSVGQLLSPYLITPTNREPITGMGFVQWLSVLKRLGIAPDRVRWWYSYHIGLENNPRGHQIGLLHEEPEVVGFQLREEPR